MGRELRMECQEPPSCFKDAVLDREGTVRGSGRLMGFMGTEEETAGSSHYCRVLVCLFRVGGEGCLFLLCLGNFTGPSSLISQSQTSILTVPRTVA